ncbi:MAG: GNAT family N-acetyltransferase [Phyllobacteriaceae bacterium]|nr:GNAT family N-acetyltransferase [Phyllobacteriaceae bacterium]
MVDALRLRKHLDQTITAPPLPPGVVRLPVWQAKPAALHKLLERAYASGGGSVPGFAEWFFPLVEDEEFDPALLIVLASGEEPVGLVQCWTSGFIKDIVVAPEARDKGLGAWLLHAAFAELQQRGRAHVDLKVEAGNIHAQRFYRRHGMVEV